MKTAAKCRLASVLATLIAGGAADAVAQGILTPPTGTPAPTMRTLSQIEPRTPIAELPYAITAPGSYYLVSNLTVGAGSDGISVQASNVTLDLGGFTLSGPGDDSGRGIYQSLDCNGLHILNGTVTGFWGSSAGGVYLEGANNQVDSIRVIDNYYGVYCENMTRITGCTAYANYGDGITLRRGTMSGCAANGNQGHGINGESFAASDCTSSENSGFGFYMSDSGSLKGCVAKANQGGGISASADSVVSACVVEGNFANGIELFDGANVSGCTVSNNRNNGIQAQSKARITENVCRFNGQRADGAGIYVTGFGNRIEKNQVTDTVRGLQITGTGNIVAENTVLDNADNYVIAAGNRLNLLLCEVPETLEWPCSVKLAGTLTCLQTGVNGITVNADDVTVDLAGHALVGPGADSGHGIYQPSSYKNLRVLDGTVSDWRGTSLVESQIPAALAAFGNRTSLDNVKADDCTMGINVNGSGCALTRCQAHGNAFFGLSAGVDARLTDCVSAGNNLYGINAGTRGRLERCAARDNGNDGIHAGSGASVLDCEAAGNTGDGIEVSDRAKVERNVCSQNGNAGDGAGIHVTGSGCRVARNQVAENDRGLDLDNGLNTVEENAVSGNTVNYDFAAGNRLNLLLSQVPETLKWPCSAKLAGSLTLTVANTNAITIASSNVTLDLGGHTLQGTSGSLAGIAVLPPAAENIHLFNGAIRGFEDFGVQAVNINNSRLERLMINGLLGSMFYGIRLQALQEGACCGNTISECTVQGGRIGVTFDPRDGRVEGNRISACTILDMDSYGIYVAMPNTGELCRNLVIDTLTVFNCYNGIFTEELRNSVITRCSFNVLSTGLKIQGRGITITENYLTCDPALDSNFGIHLGGSGTYDNHVSRNTCVGFDTNYSIEPNNTYGPIVTAAGPLSGTDPWANFSR